MIAIYADRLQRQGHSVTVIAGPYPRPTVKQRLKTLFYGSPQMAVFNPETSHFADLQIRCVTLDRPRPLREADVPDGDVIIASWWETAEWIAALSPAKGRKVYFIQHHEVFEYLPRDRVEATYRLPFFQIAIAQWLVDILQTRYGAGPVALVPNGVDLNQFYSAPRSKAAVPTVGLVYSVTPWKGCDIALEAVRQVRQQHPDLHLVAFGVAAPKATLPLPPGTEFFLQPPQHQLKDLYGRCDAWLFSSRVEGFGLPILEAMACRTPVIATPAGAATEIVGKGGGILLDAFDAAAMAQAICRLCDMDLVEWQQQSERAYAIAAQYSWEESTRRFEAALYQAVND
ncbi:MAG: glycosyltransferase family 4 protein [Thermosynechococcaceae cyanobacterium]